MNRVEDRAGSGGGMAGGPEVLLSLQRAAVEREPFPGVDVRKDRLHRAIDMIVKNEKRMIEAAQADFGQRPEISCLLSDLMFPVTALRHALRHVERWMKPEKRRADFPMGLLGARTYVFYQPLGVAGIISPWNVPFGLAFAPLAGVLAAGNRAMIKPSEFTPHSSAVMAEITSQSFGADEVAVVEGGVEVARHFSGLPFDHLLFTGSAPVAREVMRAASRNLTPVTLELGGKAPVIIARGADLEQAAEKVVSVKLGNGGQICMGVDHVLVNHDDRDAFVAAVRQKVAEFFPDYETNPDLAYVFLESQRQRLAGLVKDAANRGVDIEIAGHCDLDTLAAEPNFPLVLIHEPPGDSAVMNEEIFGPLLPVLGYHSLEEVARELRLRERPLALYCFGGSDEERQYLLENTWSGGVSFDDVMLHTFMQELPFGGVGQSGMGRYGGHAGFKTFSNARSVAYRPWIDITGMQPPFTPKMSHRIRKLIGIS